jgi:hypothetical protein
MRALLMHPDRDFDPYLTVWEETHTYRREAPAQRLTPYQQDLIQDLELDTLLQAMAGNDEFLLQACRKALFSGSENDLNTVLHRQQVLADCLREPTVITGLYNLSIEANEGIRRSFWSLNSTYPSSVLYDSTSILGFLSGMLRRLRAVGEEHAGRFMSPGFTALFAMLSKELSDDYLQIIRGHLAELKFRKGVLLSTELGEWGESADLALRKPPDKEQSWLERILGKGPLEYRFHLDPRDEAGARIVSDMRSRGIARVAVALAESADHVLRFFRMLATELAFYIGCMNLYSRLAAKGEQVCFPTPVTAGERKLSFRGLYDVCLSLHLEDRVVSNNTDADGKSLIVVTGANQGGKSTFLRSVGLAQTMMQCGMFVGAESFTAELCPALFTHYKREEDKTMKSGKFDEEIARMSRIADHIVPDSIILFNESFAATNEREGAEIATQVVRALLEKRVKIVYVTHLYEFARGFFDKGLDKFLFLRAERRPDGTRTFKVVEGEPLQTSYGEDLYREVFAVDKEPAVAD